MQLAVAAFGFLTVLCGVLIWISSNRVETLKGEREQRALTAKQRAQILERLRELSARRNTRFPAVSLEIVYVEGNDESEQFARQLADVFFDADWNLWGRFGSPRPLLG
jgi:hypothetical protein